MKWLAIILVAVVGTIVALTVYLQPNSFMSCSTTPTDTSECGESDAIVVVSGGNTIARTDAGIALYKNGWANKLVFSGAALDKTGPSNAAAMREQALAAGIPESVIFVDEESANTQQNAENTLAIFNENNIENAILVTSGYHQRRASLEFNKLANSVTIRNYPVINDQDWSWFWWVSPRGWWLAGGEMVKIIAYHVGVSS